MAPSKPLPHLYLKALEAKSGSAYHKGFLELLSLVNLVLANTTNSIRVGPRSLTYRFLLSELSKVGSDNLSIITFNYDLLIERVLAEINVRGRGDVFSYPGCYRLEDVPRAQPIRSHPQFSVASTSHEYVSVLKLHGSMN